MIVPVFYSPMLKLLCSYNEDVLDWLRRTSQETWSMPIAVQF